MLLSWPLDALASHDLFNTEKSIAQEPLASPNLICPPDLITNKLTLMNVVELALCNNPQTRMLWANSRAQAAQLGTSISSYLPTFAGPVSSSSSWDNTGINNGYTKGASVTVSYLLYDFGGREATVENAKQLLVAANATRDATLQTIYLNAVQSYYALLAARASVQSSLAAEEAAQRSLDAAQ
ncbi:MAG: TolC family protein, partial [Gallionellaceae bacterium]